MESNHLIIAIAIFSLTYMVIISEKMHRTSIAMFGAALMLIFSVETQKNAIGHIDFNTIGLLVGMMIIVNVTRRTGIFEFVAIYIAKKAKGDPWKILVSFMIATAVFSALLDNVTTILLIAPVTLVITDILEANPIPYLLPEILISNIGGTATLIGDPPNIMIGSANNIGFLEFLFNLGPIVIVISIVTIIMIKFIYKNAYNTTEENKKKIMELSTSLAIRDKKLLIKSLIALGITMLGFVLHVQLGFESATVALFGASLLLLISRINPEEVLLEVEWPTIFFFISLFILVGSLEEIGAIHYLATRMIDLTHGDLFITVLLVLWVSAIASAFLDNIPFVATMIPLIQSIGMITEMNIMPLWWALALGACLGGNGTLVGASANVMVAGMLEKHGHKLSFINYMKVGFPVMLVSVAISSIYLIVFYI